MCPRRVYTYVTVFAAFLLALPTALALDERGATAVINQFLGSQKLEQGATADAAQHVIADLDADGKPDIVLMWNVMGPTWHRPKLTLFIDQGKAYRTLTADLAGQTQKLSVKGSMILVDTMTHGPNDARCCPTRKTLLRYQWTGSKLVALK